MVILERKDLEGSGGEKPDVVDEFDERIRKEKAAEAVEKRKQNPIPMKVVRTENGVKAQYDRPTIFGIEWPGERIFAADIGYWYVALLLWVLGWIVTSVFMGKLSGLVTFVYALAFLTWISLFCVKTLLQNYRAKPVFAGVIGKKVSYGTVLILWPFEKLIMFPTGVQQINLTGLGKKDTDKMDDKDKKTGAGILTSAGLEKIPIGDGKFVEKQVPRILIPVKPVLNFRWHSKDTVLTESIKNAPPPDDLDELNNQIGEAALDIIRSEGGKETFVWLLQNRDAFAAKINEALRLTEKEAELFDNPEINKASDTSTNPKKALAELIHLMGLRNLTVSFSHMVLHDDLLKALIDEASAIHKGEASKIILKLEAEGKAYAEAVVRTAILDVVIDKRYKDVSVLLEQLRAFTEASKTGKTTVVVPSGILDMLGSSLGKVSGKDSMSKEEIVAMVMPTLQQLVKEQARR